jgi:hypothetical protein
MRLLLLSLLACSALALPVAAQAQLMMNDLLAVPVKVRGADCALFPAAASMRPYVQNNLVKGRFTPTSQQVSDAEHLLPVLKSNYLQSDSSVNYANLNYVQGHLPKYKRQYFGFYNKQRQPCLFINFLGYAHSQWLNRLTYVDDGGNLFWRIRYNLTTHQFYSFSQNGWGG